MQAVRGVLGSPLRKLFFSLADRPLCGCFVSGGSAHILPHRGFLPKLLSHPQDPGLLDASGTPCRCSRRPVRASREGRRANEGQRLRLCLNRRLPMRQSGRPRPLSRPPSRLPRSLPQFPRCLPQPAPSRRAATPRPVPPRRQPLQQPLRYPQARPRTRRRLPMPACVRDFGPWRLNLSGFASRT